MLEMVPTVAVMLMTFPSIGSGFVKRLKAFTNRKPAMSQMMETLIREPNTSACWNPKVRCEFGFMSMSRSVKMLTMKLLTSLIMCMASVIMASEFARKPPTSSTIIIKMDTSVALLN